MPNDQIKDENDLALMEQELTEFKAAVQDLSDSVGASTLKINDLSGSLSKSFDRALNDLVIGGKRAGDVFKDLASSMISSAYSSAVTPVLNQVSQSVASGLVGLVSSPFTGGMTGTGFQPKVSMFAKGGVVSSATVFPMHSGIGMMGEAGPEAIMPLERGADGRLGVRSQTATQPVNVTMNISTPDAGSFERSSSQISARLSRAMSLGQKIR